MSTTDTGISGSSTSFSASQRRSSTGGPASLQGGNVLGVHRTTALPALQDLVPANRAVLVQPALVLGVEVGRERHIDQVALVLRVEVGRHLEPNLLAERHDLRHP